MPPRQAATRRELTPGADVPLTPADFDPWRDQITGCHCATCRACAYAMSDVLDFRGEKHRATAAGLLRALKAGTHVHVSWTEHIAAAKADKAERLAAARIGGASPEHIAFVERGYISFPMFGRGNDGVGIGIGGRIDVWHTEPVAAPAIADVVELPQPATPAAWKQGDLLTELSDAA